METLILFLHVLSGGLALLAGGLALLVRKGGRWHRQAGQGFVLAMTSMGLSGLVVALFREIPVSVLAGLLVSYLSISGWAALRQPGPRWTAWLCVLGLACLGMAAWMAQAHGDPASPALRVQARAAYLVAGGLALVAVIGDLWQLAGRGHSTKVRLLRHVWRMSVAMLIATVSFFMGQADEFPAWLRSFWVNTGPVILVLMALVYFWVKVALGNQASKHGRKLPVPQEV